ncbi:nicotinamide riboside transporter PnuC [Planococcus sp. FY231025]|uniref:nicotinamide riboside transporter PnuC n=1 Tax=Planococcus sp. FY231025 TaxID=3455699 RepID=UPI003F8F7EF7
MKVIKFFKRMSLFEKLFVVLGSLAMIGLSVYWGDAPIALIAGLLGFLCVFLCAKGSIWNYPLGVANVILYAYISYGAGFYGEVMLNGLYYLPMNILGWYIWFGKSKQADPAIKEKTEMDVEVKAVTVKQKALLVAGSAAAIVLYAWALMLMGGNLPIIDATTTVLSIVAMILMVKRIAFQWNLWIFINAMSMVLWGYNFFFQNGETIAMLVMWSLYLINSIYGYTNWRKAERAVLGIKDGQQERKVENPALLVGVSGK